MDFDHQPDLGSHRLDEGSELIAPFSERPKLLSGVADLEDATSWSRFVAPQRNWVQQTFEHEMAADDKGHVHVAIVNSKLGAGTGVAISYDKRAMPHYIEPAYPG